MFDKSYVTVNPETLIPLIDRELKRLEASLYPSYDKYISYWEPRMRQKRWFGLVRPYWRSKDSPTIEEVNDYVAWQDCDWGIDSEFKSQKAIDRRYREVKHEFEQLRVLAETTRDDQQLMYLKLSYYNNFINIDENSLYILWNY